MGHEVQCTVAATEASGNRTSADHGQQPTYEEHNTTHDGTSCRSHSHLAQRSVSGEGELKLNDLGPTSKPRLNSHNHTRLAGFAHNSAAPR
jgi:hypothetical protein